MTQFWLREQPSTSVRLASRMWGGRCGQARDRRSRSGCKMASESAKERHSGQIVYCPECDPIFSGFRKSFVAKGLTKWRRRGSNTKTDQRKRIAGQQLTDLTFPLSGNCQESSVSDWLDLSSIDTELRQLIVAWKGLSKSVQEEILKLTRRGPSWVPR